MGCLYSRKTYGYLLASTVRISLSSSVYLLIHVFTNRREELQPASQTDK